MAPDPPALPRPPPPARRRWWRGKDSNLRRRKPADLQSAPVGRLGTPPRKNEPRILVATPRSVNGIGATFATVFGGLFPTGPSRRNTPGWRHINEWSGGPESKFSRFAFGPASPRGFGGTDTSSPVPAGACSLFRHSPPVPKAP